MAYPEFLLREEVDKKADEIEADLRAHNYGTHYPRVYGKDISRVWSLRKAGLGLLSGMPGSAKPVSVIEDTAVAPQRLPAYIADMKKMLDGYGLSCVYHAHIENMRRIPYFLYLLQKTINFISQ